MATSRRPPSTSEGGSGGPGARWRGYPVADNDASGPAGAVAVGGRDGEDVVLTELEGDDDLRRANSRWRNLLLRSVVRGRSGDESHTQPARWTPDVTRQGGQAGEGARAPRRRARRRAQA